MNPLSLADPMVLARSILIGAFAGWLAGQLLRGKSFGIVRNAIIGLIGGVFGNWLFSYVPVPIHSLGHPLLVQIVITTVGAVALLLFVELVFHE